VALEVTVGLINGIKVGIEHIDVREPDDDALWLIAIDLFVVRIGILKYSDMSV